jgi:hypothetical protein
VVQQGIWLAAAPDRHDERQFTAERPNQKWIADFTYIWTAEGWLYVAAVIDLFSRRLVGWSMKAQGLQVPSGPVPLLRPSMLKRPANPWRRTLVAQLHGFFVSARRTQPNRAVIQMTATETQTPQPTSNTREKNICKADPLCGTSKMIVALIPARRLAEESLLVQHAKTATVTAAASVAKCEPNARSIASPTTPPIEAPIN